jgi:hypothetical protein
MSRMPLQPAVLVLGLLALASHGEPRLGAQAPPITQRAVDDAGLTITCETFCSETKLRTANARIRWHASNEGPEASRFAAGRPSLQATVFAEGFEKDLYVTVQVAPDAPGRRAAAAPALAQQSRELRAYQFQVLEVEAPRRSTAGTDEFGVVLEDLEPGVNYSWRVAIETASGTRLSPVVKCEVPVCPADLIEPPRPRPGEQR